MTEKLEELSSLLQEEIFRLMDTKDERELALLDVLTDACMEVEEFIESCRQNGKDSTQH